MMVLTCADPHLPPPLLGDSFIPAEFSTRNPWVLRANQKTFEQWLLNPRWLMISLWVLLPLTHWEFSLIIIEHELGVTS